MRDFRLVAAMLAACMMAGCASVPRQQAYDPAVRSKIRTIGLLTPVMSDDVAVRMFVHPVESLGVIGVLLAEGDMSGKTGEFTSALAARGIRFRSRFQDDLVAGIRRAGYDVRLIPVSRPKNEQFHFLSRYPAADGSVDAYLDLYAQLIGYAAAGYNSPYRPTVYLAARLVRASDHAVLYEDGIAYNAFGEPRDMVTIEANDRYAFNAFSDLMSHQDQAAEGLQVALKATGDELGRQLR